MKILLADYPHYSGRARARALQSLGHEVSFFDHVSDRFVAGPRRDWIKRWLKAALPNPYRWRMVRRAESRAMHRQLLDQIGKFKPDLVLTIKGATFEESTLRAIRSLGKPMVCYFGDPLAHPSLIGLAQAISAYYDAFFIIDEMDILNTVPLSAPYIGVCPSAVDPQLFRPVELSQEERREYACDIAFIGSIYPSRVDLLRDIARSKYDFRIWGRPVVDGFDWRAGQPDLARRYMGRYLEDDEMPKVYSAARIVISLHGTYGETKPAFGMPFRPFEAAACRTLVLSDDGLQVRRLFDVGKEIDTYRDPQDLFEKVKQYLDDEPRRAAIAEAGYRRILRDHTWDTRMKDLMIEVRAHVPALANA